MYDYHEPVLLAESLEGLALKKDGIYVDATFGGGGHSRAILPFLDGGKLLAFDQDPDAEANTRDVVFRSETFSFIPANFRYLKRYLRLEGVTQVDGILADLGVSWHQFKTPQRGFSIHANEAKLDMRMDKNSDNSNTARSILNTYYEDDLAQLFEQYGELPKSRRLAQAIVRERRLRPFKTIEQLKIIAQPFAPNPAQVNKYYAQLFQALRIEVNEEIVTLQELLIQASELLSHEGRLVIIAYHSLEDRIVKNYIKRGAFDDGDHRDMYGNSYKPFKAVNKKVITPNNEELKRNPKSSSAKLRIGERIRE